MFWSDDTHRCGAVGQDSRVADRFLDQRREGRQELNGNALDEDVFRLCLITLRAGPIVDPRQRSEFV